MEVLDSLLRPNSIWDNTKLREINEEKMTVFLTACHSCLAAIQRGHWLVTPLNNIARYCEKMLIEQTT